MPQFRIGPARLRQRLPPHPAAEGEDALGGRTGPVLLSVEEDGAARHSGQSGASREEEIRPPSGHHRLHGPVLGRAGDDGSGRR